AERDCAGSHPWGVARSPRPRFARLSLSPPMLRKLGALLALWLVLLVLALSTGWNAVWVLVHALGLLVAGSALWANWNVSGLELRRRHRATRVQVGDTLAEPAILGPEAGPGQWRRRRWFELGDGSDV